MTLDHLQVFFPILPIPLRWVGRLAIPLFMFVTIQGFFSTKDRKNYMKRLYGAGVITQIVFALVGWSNTFIKVLFLLTVILWIFEEEIPSKKRCYLILFTFYQIFSLTLLYPALRFLFLKNPLVDFLSFLLFGFEIGDFCMRISIVALGILIPGEDILILVFGILIYLTYSKKCLMMISGGFFGIIYFILTTTDFVVRVINKLARMGFSYLAMTLEALRPFVGLGHFDIGGNPLTENFQWMMFFTLPLLLTYSGEKGKSGKYFFYLYYPTHIVILTVLSTRTVL